MRLNLFYSNIFYLLLISIILFIFNNTLYAKSVDEQVEEIATQLRCMTCQNQTIYDSEADFSKDLKNIIKKQVEEGKSSQEIINFMVERYGEFIVFRPLINKKNIVLWVFPFLLFLFSLIFMGFRLKK